MYSIIYYSPTGNTKYLAEKLSAILETSKSDIHKLEKTEVLELEKTENLILMYPIHGFNPPRTVLRFVKAISKNTYKRVHLIAVGCNTMWLNDNVSASLVKVFKSLDIDVVVNEIIAMPLTLVMDFTEDEKKKTIRDAELVIEEIGAKILNNEMSKNTIKLKSKFISLIGKLENPASRLFGLELHSNKDCTSCGICWNNCPENNIKPNKKDRPKFGLSCSMCMRCIYDCPTKSISPYISKFLTIKGGYSLDE